MSPPSPHHAGGQTVCLGTPASHSYTSSVLRRDEVTITVTLLLHGALQQELCPQLRPQRSNRLQQRLFLVALPFLAGTASVDQATGQVMYRGDPYRQTRQALAIVESALQALGSSLKDVVSPYCRGVMAWLLV